MTARVCTCHCAVLGCSFAAVGVAVTVQAIAVASSPPGEERRLVRYGVCAVHRDHAVRHLIDRPTVETVWWEPRADWALDGLEAA